MLQNLKSEFTFNFFTQLNPFCGTTWVERVITYNRFLVFPELCLWSTTNFSGTIEQNLHQPFLGLSGRSGGPGGQQLLVTEFRQNISLG